MKFHLPHWSLLISLLFTTLEAIPRGRRAIRNRNEGDINSVTGIGRYLVQGDIAVVQTRSRRAVIKQKHKKWKLPMPYSFDWNFPRRSRLRVLEAMRFWSEKTCVTFQENRYVYPHVRIFEGNGCWSFVGKQQSLREQSLSLESSCTDHTFVVAHEIAHTLGFFHEHARIDRDQFISIDYSNVNPNLTFAFAKESEKQLDHQSAPYEYGSVMHYSVDQFAVNTNRPVIYARDQKYAQAMGNRMRATFQDVSRMNVLYNCHERCANTVNRCQHGGYPAPSDCSQCVCPDGFGGQFCETIENQSIGQNGNSDCGGILWTSPSKNIEIRIKNIISPCSMSCSFNALELKLSNFTMTGTRFCCDEHIYSSHSNPKIFQSDGPLAVIGAYARYDYLDFNIEYRGV
ncbi:Protein CBR-NAS-27 [Caenorhabditis briggsae]|uniref:Zinc metalloproteinase n=1 Tax=Caenorhabditis briggsae TaxID=6238 RepID=A8X3P5_CAEBR|nr:Protein CBR-NAS-27 [Caenorhabditis briggsae]CAP27255.2 Protein CBR-NAS-27 [Caenorhabditis briggsae]